MKRFLVLLVVAMVMATGVAQAADDPPKLTTTIGPIFTDGNLGTGMAANVQYSVDKGGKYFVEANYVGAEKTASAMGITGSDEVKTFTLGGGIRFTDREWVAGLAGGAALVSETLSLTIPDMDTRGGPAPTTTLSANDKSLEGYGRAFVGYAKGNWWGSAYLMKVFGADVTSGWGVGGGFITRF